MTTLNVVLTHLPPAAVNEGLSFLDEVAPQARFAVCHVGDEDALAGVAREEKVFVDEPSFNGLPYTYQSLNAILDGVHDRLVRPDPGIDAVYLLEYDHLVLRPDFEERLSAVAAATGADFMGKTCGERTATNWFHYVRFRRDERLLEHLRSVSVRADPTRMYGCLGNGFWLSRTALEAFVAVEDHPPCYGELYVPTLLHHLGFELVDIDTHSDLYRHVRWYRPFAVEEVVRLKRDGAVFVHPFKDTKAIGAVRSAPGPDSGALSAPETSTS
ncbi:MAG: hypothetical protein H0V40_05260 [Actinobacteria bacterium]|nr:hypothetical protein [Actinomycetota bacterium]